MSSSGYRRLVLGVLVFATTCRVSDQSVFDRVHLCDGNLPSDTCGTTREGVQMMCYQARQIGVRDFCTEECVDKQANASGPGWKCVDNRVRMRTCRPSQESSCPPDTACLRTDGIEDEGVCVAMNTCKADADCTNPEHPTCIGSILAQWYGPASGVHTDHFSCLQTGCEARRSACAAGESCLPRVIPASSDPLDICVPNCDAKGNCPPNYLCLRSLSGPGAPAVCIPTIMGFRCLTDMDCMLGQCRDTGDGFNICAVPCETHDDCLKFGSTRGIFSCVPDPGGQGKYCHTTRAYGGAFCATNAHCRSHEKCTKQSPEGPGGQAECRPRCGPGFPACTNRGGVPHVCLELDPGEPTCNPGSFFVPCEKDADCVGTLKCIETTDRDADGSPVKARRCSTACQTDEECDKEPYVEHVGFCEAGTCARVRRPGGVCDSDAQCVPQAKCQPAQTPEDQQRGLKRCR